MEGIANSVKAQQSQLTAQETQRTAVQERQVEQPTQTNVVKQMQEDNSDTSKKIDSKEQINEVVDELNKALAPMNTSLKFGVDFEDIFYVSVIDIENNKMIRRFPAEEAIGFLPKFKEVSGILFDSKG